MPAEIWVPLAVAIIGVTGALLGSSVSRREERRVTAEQTANESVEKAYEQRLLFRDEQIEALREQVAALTAEVRRLTAIIEQLGGQP